MIFNKSLEEGTLPSVWLESIIVPLFKAKSRYGPMNYRPESHVCVLQDYGTSCSC